MIGLILAYSIACAVLRRYRVRMSKRAVSLALVSFTLSSSLAVADDAIYDEQQLAEWRDTFRAVLPDVERGNWSPAAES